MTIGIFISLFTIGSAVASLLTQALKKGWSNLASNVTAFIVSFVVGVVGTSSAYILTGAVWDAKNTVCIILMTFCVWIGSMVGYDKVIQLLKQIKE